MKRERGRETLQIERDKNKDKVKVNMKKKDGKREREREREGGTDKRRKSDAPWSAVLTSFVL